MENAKNVALVTGANRGLGLETARQLAQKGVTVVLAARKLASAEEAAAKLKSEGLNDIYAIQLDVTKGSERSAAAQQIEKQFGRLDILVNNAGIAPTEGGAFEKRTINTSEAELHEVFNTNVFSTILLTHDLLPLLLKSEGGRIVNLSSILGSLTLHSQPNGPIAAAKRFSYNASKTALNAFTVHLADELKDTRIKVNSVHPGWVKTEMGSEAAPMEIPDGARTSVELALIGPDGPTGRFIHQGQELPW
ncbi:MAG: SDR family oxidoreductase [Acidobacteriaceae bacterium]|nr:SDR family oxidoreductase [Acidobacteriaceae bacterium]